MSGAVSISCDIDRNSSTSSACFHAPLDATAAVACSLQRARASAGIWRSLVRISRRSVRLSTAGMVSHSPQAQKSLPFRAGKGEWDVPPGRCLSAEGCSPTDRGACLVTPAVATGVNRIYIIYNITKNRKVNTFLKGSVSNVSTIGLLPCHHTNRMFNKPQAPRSKIALGSLISNGELRRSDEETVERIRENPDHQRPLPPRIISCWTRFVRFGYNASSH